MLLSFWRKRFKEFSFRWIFGIATIFLLLGIGTARVYVKQDALNFTLPDSTEFYIGYVTEMPQEKPRSVAHKIHLVKENVDVVCYLAKDSLRLPLEVGDEIAFLTQLQPFKNMGNPDDFDYEQYMYNQGFVASSYLSSASWLKTGNHHSSLRIVALKARQMIMNVYSSLGFTEKEQAILSALTLGYQDTLSDDLKQAFRTTGTVHVLSVSGLHVGIIYGVIAFLLSFISVRSRFYKIRPVIIILLLWTYAFVTGLPPSVVRASTMLSLFCLSELIERKNNPLNTLYIAAFFMLLYNPFWLFDIGFQLSFLSVLSILVLYKPLSKQLTIKNRLLRGIWQMLCISLVAQLATFPLCLYYFGTFPTYFFIANLLVIPLVTLITYGMGLVFLAWMIAVIIPQYADIVYWLPIKIEQFLVSALSVSVKLFEELPYALVENVNMCFIELLLVMTIIGALLITLYYMSVRSLIVSLVLIVLLLGYNIYYQIKPQADRLIVYNRGSNTDISMIKEKEKVPLTDFISEKKNPVLNVDGKKILFANSAFEENLLANKKYEIDYAIITEPFNSSIDALQSRYKIDTLIVDGSLHSFYRHQLTKECEKNNIPLHDVTKDGAFTIFFTTFAH